MHVSGQPSLTVNIVKLVFIRVALLVRVFVQVRLVQRVQKATLVHRDILDSEAQMVKRETRDYLVSQVSGSQDIQEKR